MNTTLVPCTINHAALILNHQKLDISEILQFYKSITGLLLASTRNFTLTFIYVAFSDPAASRMLTVCTYLLL